MPDVDPMVVPWDFSPFAQLAIQFATERFSDQPIHVICVLEKPSPYVSGMNWGEDAEQQAIEKCQHAFRTSSKTVEFRELPFAVLFGDPATEIVRYASDQSASGIVMSTHGRTGLQRWYPGSVAQQVVRRAPCPVWVLPKAWVESRRDKVGVSQ